MEWLRVWPLHQDGNDYVGSTDQDGFCALQGGDDPFTRLIPCGTAHFGERGGHKCSVLGGEGFLRWRRHDMRYENPSNPTQIIARPEWTIVFDVWHDKDTPANLGGYGSGREVYVTTTESGNAHTYLFRDEYDGHLGLMAAGHQGVQAGNPPAGVPMAHNQWHRMALGRKTDGIFVVHNGSMIFEGRSTGGTTAGDLPGFGAEWRPGVHSDHRGDLTYPLHGGIKNVMVVGQALTPAEITALTLPTLAQTQGNVITANGHAVQEVVIHNAETRELIKRFAPEPNGEWATYMRRGQTYSITYFADGCAPITHGPYTVPET